MKNKNFVGVLLRDEAPPMVRIDPKPRAGFSFRSRPMPRDFRDWVRSNDLELPTYLRVRKP